MKKKKDICLKYDLNCVFLSEVKDIIKYIKDEKKDDNKRG